MNYLIYALISFVIQVFLTGIFIKSSAKGTIIKNGDIWRLELDEDPEKLDRRKRIIFNVSYDEEVNNLEN